MIAVTFFNPPRSRFGNDHIVNMSMLWLVGLLAEEGLKSTIRLPCGDSLYSDVAAYLEKDKPRYVAISCKWWNTLYGALEVARAVRKCAPNIPIIMGGHTATVFADDLVATGLVDVVLLGDVDTSLLRLVQEGEVVGGVTPTGRHVANDGDLRSFRLDHVTIPHPQDVTDKPHLFPAYVWVGRGCCHPCFYCLENREGSRKWFNRQAARLRSVEAVLRDAASFNHSSRLIFDYEHPSIPATERFITELAAKKPENITACYYFCWGLPSRQLLDILSQSFQQVEICLDIQIFAERLRFDNAERGLIKPFFANSAILEVLEYAETKPNIHIDATGIVGMPWETAQDRETGLSFIEGLYRKYNCVRDWRFSPLHVIPGTALAQQASFEDLTVIRRSYQDFLDFTREAYDNQISYYSTDRQTHPFGVYPQYLPRVIVDFMEKADTRLKACRDSRRQTAISRFNDETEIRLTDPLTPLRTLFDMLETLVASPALRLRISLGPRTWFFCSWNDYSSESGENSALMTGLSGSAETDFGRLLEVHGEVVLEGESANWGVLKQVVQHLLPST
jgi:hypothetical protein